MQEGGARGWRAWSSRWLAAEKLAWGKGIQCSAPPAALVFLEGDDAAWKKEGRRCVGAAQGRAVEVW